MKNAGNKSLVLIASFILLVAIVFTFVVLLPIAGEISASGLQEAAIEGQIVFSDHPETMLSAGAYHTCALRSNGSIACWGLNKDGQATPPDGTFIQVSSGANHTCGLKIDNTVVCWGNNKDGKATAPGGEFLQVSAGDVHSCGLRTDGEIVCWGWNQDGFLDLRPGPYIQVSAGVPITCGLRANGSITCAGSVDYKDWDYEGPFSQVGAGDCSIAGLTLDGKFAFKEECPLGKNLNALKVQSCPWPFSYCIDGPFVQISHGAYSGSSDESCALKPDGSVECWRPYGDRKQVAGPFRQISAGRFQEADDPQHFCGLKFNGSIECWGNNNYGQAAAPDDVFGPPQCAPVEGNLIQNFCFTGGYVPWRFWDGDGGGKWGVSTSNPFAGEGSARIVVNAPGRNIQLYQKELALQPNTTYELSFAAYSEDGRDMGVVVHKHGMPYTNYGLHVRRVDLDKAWRLYSYTFDTPDLADMSDGRLRFWFAPYAEAGTVYHIDHVVLRPVSNP